MTQPERLQAIEHALQSLSNRLEQAADHARERRNHILRTLNRIEAKLDTHIEHAKAGYRVLYDRANDIYREVHLVTLMNERILDSINSTNPDRAKELAQ